MPQEYDIVVIGTGAVGSAAFYHAAKLGQRVLALEQFDAAHDRGSSHGQTRIIRLAYFEHPNYVPLLRDSYRLWSELEQRLDRRLYVETGLLEVGFRDGPVIQGILRSAQEHDLSVDTISDAEWARRFSCFKKLPQQVALFERSAGYLLVEPCVRAHIDAAIGLGGEFRATTKVTHIAEVGQRVVVTTDDGVFSARGAIVSAGAWSSQWLPLATAMLRVVRKHQYWLTPNNPGFAAAEGCPTFFFETADGFFYGFPRLEPYGLKVARHTGGQIVDDPTNVDRSIDHDDWQRVRQFASTYLGEDVATAARHAVCMYTMSPDEHFIVDRHPQLARIVFCAGLSGHGFKFAPVLGRRLVGMLHDQEDARFDFLRLSRFHP